MSARRRQPTKAQIRQRRCFRCGRRPGYSTWAVCADDNRLRALCRSCDVALNRLVLRWAGDPQWQVKLHQYVEAIASA